MAKTAVIPLLLADKSFDSNYLPLGMIMAYAKSHKQGLLHKYFDFLPVRWKQESEKNYYINLAKTRPGSIWAVPCYVWNFRYNLEVARQVKVADPSAIIIAGGPNVPKYHKESRTFLIHHPFVDIAIRGEGEVTFAETLEAIRNGKDELLLQSVNGISFLVNGEYVRTPDRTRVEDLDTLPSPYLTGEFDYPEYDGAEIFISETNRGCPYGCTFCDWGAATVQKIKKFDLQRVMDEIQIISDKKAKSLIIADANFGAFPRDVDITWKIANCRNETGFPAAFSTNFAKNASTRIADIVRVLRENKLQTSGILSMQSTDQVTLDAIDRTNIKTSKYEELIGIFRENGLRLSSDLLIGLPEQTYESFKKDLQFFIDRKIITVCYRTMLLANSPMNAPEYRERYQIRTDQDDYVISTSTATANDIDVMELLYLVFQVFYLLGITKYLLYYVQVESRGRILFIEVLSQMIKLCMEGEKYPIMSSFITIIKENAKQQVNAHKLLVEWSTEQVEYIFNNMKHFYDEWFRFLKHEYDFEFSPSVQETLLIAQMAVMPQLGKTTPYEADLPHNFVSYFKQIQSLAALKDDSYLQIRPLQEFPPGKIVARSFKNKTYDNLNLKFRDLHNNTGWELRSPLRFY